MPGTRTRKRLAQGLGGGLFDVRRGGDHRCAADGGNIYFGGSIVLARGTAP